MPEYIDLHVHSDHSDGLQTPRDVIDHSLARGLKAVSITDHDSVAGYREAAAYAVGRDIEVIAGVELSAARTDEDLHFLGYLFQPENERLNETLEKFRGIRYERGKKMVDRLAKLGLRVDYDNVLAEAGRAAVGRPHLAEAMVKGGCVSSYAEAFNRYLIVGGPAYVPKAKLTPAEAIMLIHQAGGMAVMAHPALTDRDDMIEALVAWGLDGIEIYHPTHKVAAQQKYREIARRHGLCVTGGSDSHNRKDRFGDIGTERVPYTCLLDLKATWRLSDNSHHLRENSA